MARNYQLRGESRAAGLVICGISQNSSPHRAAKRPISAKDAALRELANDCPVVGVRVWRKDLEVVRRARDPERLADRLDGAKRGAITALSWRSRRNLAFVVGNSEVEWRSMATLTYPASFPWDGKVVKGHLNSVLCSIRAKIGGRLSYVWFLEFQRRGAPHVHCFFDFALPSPHVQLNRRGRESAIVNPGLHDWLGETWFHIVNSGDPRHLSAGVAWEVLREPDGAARYAAKEAAKRTQKIAPEGFRNVGRWWGCSRDVPPKESAMIGITGNELGAMIGESNCDKWGNPHSLLFNLAGLGREIAAQKSEQVRKVKRRLWVRAGNLLDSPP